MPWHSFSRPSQSTTRLRGRLPRCLRFGVLTRNARPAQTGGGAPLALALLKPGTKEVSDLLLLPGDGGLARPATDATGMRTRPHPACRLPWLSTGSTTTDAGAASGKTGSGSTGS